MDTIYTRECINLLKMNNFGVYFLEALFNTEVSNDYPKHLSFYQY